MDSHPMYPCAKLKLDQLFLQWLALPESQTLVSRFFGSLVVVAVAGVVLGRGWAQKSLIVGTPEAHHHTHRMRCS